MAREDRIRALTEVLTTLREEIAEVEARAELQRAQLARLQEHAKALRDAVGTLHRAQVILQGDPSKQIPLVGFESLISTDASDLTNVANLRALRRPTITDAIITALERSQEPMTDEALLQAITDEGFRPKSSDPLNALRAHLSRLARPPRRIRKLEKGLYAALRKPVADDGLVGLGVGGVP